MSELPILEEMMWYLRDQRGLTRRYAERFMREVINDFSENNLQISQQLQVLFEAYQNPHVLSVAEKQQLFGDLINYAQTIDSMDDDLLGRFARESNGITLAFREGDLSIAVLTEKVLILALLLSSGRIQNEFNLIQRYRMMVEAMMIRDNTLLPLLSLLQYGERASVELLMATYQQMYLPDTLSSG